MDLQQPKRKVDPLLKNIFGESWRDVSRKSLINGYIADHVNTDDEMN